MLQDDPNPIYDPGAPTSTGGTIEATKICDVLEIPLLLKPPREKYLHGWGKDCHGAKTIVNTWELCVHDRRNSLTNFKFDLVNGSSPLVIGLDVGQHSDTINNTNSPYLSVKRPSDETELIFGTYISPDSPDNPDCIRLRVELLPRPQSRITSLMSNIHHLARDDPERFARNVHRYTHAHPDQVKTLCDHAGILTPLLEDEIDITDDACEICVRTGRPLPSKKVSLSHINEAFNQEVQIDFTYIKMSGTTHELIVIIDTGTSYSECDVVDSKSIATIIHMYEKLWICRHGASEHVSADDEYHRRRLVNFFECHGIKFKPRPTRRHNKLGYVERKNGTIKNILKRLVMENTDAPFRVIVARANFLSNLFSGSQLLSSFELVRGYQPSILGIRATDVTTELLEAHMQQTATRALQRVLRSRTPNVPTPGMFNTNDDIWVWYASSKQNEPNEWIKARVVQTHPHYMEVRRLTNGKPCRGPTMKPAYEDVRIAPTGMLAQELMETTLEEHLGYGNLSDRGESVEGNLTEGPQPTVSAMLSGVITTKEPCTEDPVPKGPTDDIGEYGSDISQADVITERRSEKARIIEEMYEQVGSHQVSRHKLSFAPPWILDQAFASEFGSNWADAFEPVFEEDVERGANVITSHTVYKIKTDEDNHRTVKARIVPHGNHDDEKDSIRKDSSTAQLSIIRLLLSVVTFLGLRLATVDIKGAYLQSGPIRRNIYVRPPKEWTTHKTYKRGVLWKLTKLPYGIVEAGRQWQKTVEDWMLSLDGLERVFGLNQLFIQRDSSGRIVLVIAKVTDDFLIGGRLSCIHGFIEKLQKRFTVGKVVVDSKFHFNGCEIIQDAIGNIRMSMMRYLDRIKPISLSRQRRKERDQPVNDVEKKQYRALAGTLLYLGNGVPQSSLVVSLMQQQVSSLTVQHLVDANDMTKELLSLKPWIVLTKPTNIKTVSYCSFSDASHPRDRDYGQTGVISGIRITSKRHGPELFHPIDWTSQRQHRVSYSSYGAEILAAATADDRGFYYKTAINSLFSRTYVSHELNVDSRALYDTVTTLHEGSEYRLRPTVQRIRNSFEARELDVARWIPGKVNVADALTKRNKVLYERLNTLCSGGVMNINLSAGYAVDSSTWI